MTSLIVRACSRRRFLQYLAGSPLFASGAISANGTEGLSKLPDPMIWAPADGELIKSPKDAINVFDFEPVAHKNVPPAHFGYMASGIDDEVTLRANREGFLKFQLLPRRLNDVSKVDTSVELFGTKYDSPIFVCPTGGNKFFHPDGEVAVAKAARAGNHLPNPLDSFERFRGGRHQCAGGTNLVPALCLAALGGFAGADQARRGRRLSGSRGDGRPCRGPKSRNLVRRTTAFKGVVDRGSTGRTADCVSL
jgi:hypothetical protein